MDADARECLSAVIQNFCLSGRSKCDDLSGAVLLTSHKMGESERLCSTLAIMSEGRIRCEGTAEEIISNMGTKLFTLLIRLGKNHNTVEVANGVRKALQDVGFKLKVRRSGNALIEFLVKPLAGEGEHSDTFRIYSALEKVKPGLGFYEYDLRKASLAEVRNLRADGHCGAEAEITKLAVCCLRKADKNLVNKLKN